MTHEGELRSECWVFAAQQIEDGPIARVKLPARAPSGFHAKWLPGDRVWSG
jgi:carotenoid cleavage dioxygenase